MSLHAHAHAHAHVHVHAPCTTVGASAIAAAAAARFAADCAEQPLRLLARLDHRAECRGAFPRRNRSLHGSHSLKAWRTARLKASGKVDLAIAPGGLGHRSRSRDRLGGWMARRECERVDCRRPSCSRSTSWSR
eukprot:6393466-Prymnesium_polylepis.2